MIKVRCLPGTCCFETDLPMPLSHIEPSALQNQFCLDVPGFQCNFRSFLKYLQVTSHMIHMIYKNCQLSQLDARNEIAL